jgi:hypothetical protein
MSSPSANQYLSNTDFFQNVNENPPINTNNNYNGRVFFDVKENVPTYELYTDSNKANNNVGNTLNYSLEDTGLSRLYFSKENMDNIQKDIIESIYNITLNDKDPILDNVRPVTIGRQNDLQLQIIMRSIFLQYAKHNNDNISGQIRELNDLVIREAIPDIITNIKQYLGYSSDIQRAPQLMDRAQNTYQQKNTGKSFLFV